MKKTFFKELEVDAKKGNKMVEKSLRYGFYHSVFRRSTNVQSHLDSMRHLWRQTDFDQQMAKRRNENLATRKKLKKLVI